MFGSYQQALRWVLRRERNKSFTNAISGGIQICSCYSTSPAYDHVQPKRALCRLNLLDMSVRVDVDDKSSDEMADLARAFNAMAEDIGFYIEQVRENTEEVRSFAYIVSHDLRSPLVNLKGFSAEIGYSLTDLQALLSSSIDSLPEEKKAQALAILNDDMAKPPGHIKVWSVANQYETVFHVRDSGPGIEAANIPIVFELFRRVGRNDTAGEGMGLAMLKHWCAVTVGVFGANLSLVRAAHSASASLSGQVCSCAHSVSARLARNSLLNISAALAGPSGHSFYRYSFYLLS